MLLEIKKLQTKYTRLSKNGIEHTYFRNCNIAILKCDCCSSTFERPAREMDPRRLSVEYSHVCPNCNPKKFAQKKGVEGRRFWNTRVDLDIDIDKI
jgi:hypothetical protein